MVSLDWPDFSIPYVEDTFWVTLIEDIYRREITSVSTQCAGGHGRTGVQLSILAYLMLDDSRHLWPDANALIAWVREKHCDNAVENKEQQEYIAKICGIPVGDIIESHKAWATTIPKVVNNYTWPDDAYILEDVLQDDGLDILMDNEVIENNCIVCFHDSVDNMGMCLSCGTDTVLFKEILLTTNVLCPVCGNDVSEAEMMDDEKVCRLCWGTEIEHGMLERNDELKCDGCRKYQPSTSFFNNIVGVQTPKENKMCARCTVKSLDKEDEKKQKSLDEYAKKEGEE